MTTTRVELRIPGGVLLLGELPRVVGTFSSAFPNFAATPFEACDIVELRLDEIGQSSGWLERCREAEAKGFPVILTIRSHAEGGKWKGTELERLKLYESAMENLSAVDIEFRSEIAASVSQRARQLGRAAIVSCHDFERTPPLPQLQAMVSEAQEFASVVKVATMIQSAGDIESLRDLIGGRWKVPICVMGMGALGAQTRASFAALGSCMTYGYLDKPVAPGQPSSAELVSQLRALLPRYNEDCLARRQAREGAESKYAPTR
jgi:3-dehydroquinate dehydratase-1